MDTIEKLQNLALQVALDQVGDAAISIKAIIDDVSQLLADKQRLESRNAELLLALQEPRNLEAQRVINLCDTNAQLRRELDIKTLENVKGINTLRDADERIAALEAELKATQDDRDYWRNK